MNEFDKELEELSIWIEANRDVSPTDWENKVWPEIKTRIKQAIEKHVIGTPLTLNEATSLIQNEKLGKLVRSGSQITIDQQRTRLHLK